VNSITLWSSMLYIPFRSGRNGRKISYRHANWYEAPPCSTSAKISACFGLFRPVYVIRPKYFFGFLYIYFFLSFDLTGPFSLFLLLLSSSSSSFFFFLLPSSFFRPALSLSLYLFFTFFFFCLFGSSAVIAVKY
jgi:hypothetical protein